MAMNWVCRTEDVPDNEMKEFELEGGKKVLVLASGGNYYAYQAICPHQDVPLCEGFYDGSVLTCHQHLWQWDVHTGAPLGLAEAPLGYYEVEVEKGNIYIADPDALKLASIFEGVSGTTHDELAALARREQYEEDAVLYDVGDAVEDIYILDAGRVEFVLGRGERTSPGGFMIRKGEVFGWAALITGQPRRIARATCKEDSSVIALNGRVVREVLERNPADGYRVMSNLTHAITRYFAAFGSQ